MPTAPSPTDVPRLLLDWYDRHRRVLPWRALPGDTANPYRVWVSEVMLQQTTAATVANAFAGFLARFPTVEALAAAPLERVLHAWQGFGYYARARNLHRAAAAVAAAGGRFPDTEAGLRELPGVGAYIAAAVAAIAFDRPATVVDANVERVVARLFAIGTPLPGGKAAIRAAAATLTPADRPGDYAQAMMDLGATICTPRTLRCMACPLAGQCRGLEEGIAGQLPAKSPKPERPLRHGVSYWLVAEDGSILLRRRPEAGLLGGMTEVPTSDFRDRPWDLADAVAAAPVAAGWQPVAGTVVHGFTHFGLELQLLAARTGAPDPALGTWSAVDRLDEHALPTLMKKVVRHAVAARSGPMAVPAAPAPELAGSRHASAVRAPAGRPRSTRRG